MLTKSQKLQSLLLGVVAPWCTLFSSTFQFSGVAACPFLLGDSHQHVARRLQALSNSTDDDHNNATVCQDILSGIDESPIKECSILLEIFPCGTPLPDEEQDILVDVVCARSCGVCLDNHSTNTTATPFPNNITETTKNQSATTFDPYKRMFRPQSANDPSVEYTVFEVSTEYVEILTMIPTDTEWVGYMLLPSSTPVTVETQEFPLVMFTIQFFGVQNVTGRGWHFVYAGPLPPALVDYFPVDGVVIECTMELQSLSGGICQFDADRGVGDFTLLFAGFLLVMRERTGENGMTVLSFQETDLERRVVWRIPSYHFLKVDDLRVRYALKPSSFQSSSSVSALPYHGGHTTHVPFTLANVPDDKQVVSIEPIVVDDFIQHSCEESSRGSMPTVCNVGGTFGWNIPPPGLVHRYQDLVVPAGTMLRFSYGFPLIVVRVASQDEWETCNIANFTILGEPLDSPFEYTLQEPGDYYFSLPESDLSPCDDGLKLFVRVLLEEEASDFSNGAPLRCFDHYLQLLFMIVAIFIL